MGRAARVLRPPGASNPIQADRVEALEGRGIALTKLLIIGVLIFLASRIIAVRLADRRWPQHAGWIVAVALIAQHLFFALIFALLAYGSAAHGVLGLLLYAAFAVCALYEGVSAAGVLHVLLRRPESLADS